MYAPASEIRHLLAQGLGNPPDRPFRGGVDREPGNTEGSGGGADVNHHPSPGVDHTREDQVGEAQEGGKVYLHHLLPLDHRLVEKVSGDEDARVIDQDRYRAELPGEPLIRLPQRVPVRDIALLRHDPAGALPGCGGADPSQGVFRLRERLLVPVDDTHPGTRLEEPHRRGVPDTPRPTADQSVSAVDLESHPSLLIRGVIAPWRPLSA